MNTPELEGPLVIDFGNTNTCAAYRHPDGTWALVDLHVHPSDSGERFPSSMLFLDHEKLSQGLWKEAIDFGQSVVAALCDRYMSRTVASRFRNHLSSDAELWIQEWKNGTLGSPKAYTGEELVKWYFKAYVAFAERRLHRRIRSLFLTYPAIGKFDETVRLKFRRAASEGTGIPLPDIHCCLAESEALVYPELLKMGDKLVNGEERCFAIVDVGGRNTDISFFKVRGRGAGDFAECHLLDSVGIDVAGMAFTFQIARLVLRLGLRNLKRKEYLQHYWGIWKELPEHWYKYDPWQLECHHSKTFQCCMHAAEACKLKLPRTLGHNDEACVNIEEMRLGCEFILGPEHHAIKQHEEFRCSNEQIRTEISGLIDQILEAFSTKTQQLITNGQLPPGDVDRILLRGNGARFTYLRDRFEEVFGTSKIGYDDSDQNTAVVMGACKYWHVNMFAGSGPQFADMYPFG